MEVHDISRAISFNLYQTFGDGYKIYIGSVPQNFQTPSFLILFLSLNQIRQIGRRWRINTLFNVQYFPKEGREEAADMALKLQRELEEIELLNGDLMFGTNIRSEIVDDVAHNFVNYNFFLQEKEAKELMWQLEHHPATKGW